MIPNNKKVNTEQETQNTNISNKVDKIDGKGLSTNDYSTEEKQKLAGLQNYDDKKVQDELNKKANSSDVYTKEETDTKMNTKQDKLTAGNNITISNNTISAKDTTYAVATNSVDGLMSKTDKAKLNNIFNLIYPVGSIYISVNSTNPANLFGGTWEQIKDRFLLSAGSSYANGSTGGSATHTIAVENLPAHTHTYSNATAVQGHTLTINEIPKHTHNLRSNYTAGGPYATPVFDFNQGHSSDDGNAVLPAGGGQAHSHGLTKANANTGSTGSGTALNTMPPYLVVYM